MTLRDRGGGQATKV